MMNLDLPSLEHSAILKIVTMLWDLDIVIFSRTNLTSLKSNFDKILHDPPNLQNIEIFLEKRILELRLPDRLAQKICNLIKPITFEIIKWLECQKRISTKEIFLKLSVKKICWTSHGTVDDKRTAEALINSEKIDVVIQYKLACNYCLEGYAKTLWEKLPFQRQHDYLYKVPQPRNIILKVMTYYIRNEINKLQLPRTDISVFEQALFQAVEYGNKAATNFFLGKLTVEVKNNTMHHYLQRIMNLQLLNIGSFCFPRGHHSEVIAILMANATTKSLENLTYATCLIILKLFLEWPVQPLFIEVVQCILKSIHTHIFYCILFRIIYKIQSGYMDYNYGILLKDFLKSGPEHKILHNLDPFDLFHHFFTENDKEGVALLLKGSSLEVKQKLIFHFRGRELCEVLVFQKNWNLLQFFINECVSEENLGIFRDLFKKVPVFLSGYSSYEFYGDRTTNYSILYRYVGDLIRTDTKRCADDTLPVAKRTRSLGYTPTKEILEETDAEWP